MIPILYDKNTMDFSTNGIGRLSDAISCVVDLEANGEYELTMVYPLTGVHFSEIQMSSIIFAKPDNKRENQAFRVYKISKPLNGKVTVYAEHISYQLSQIPVSPFTAESAASALSGLKTNAAVDCPFEFWTDKTSSGKFAVEMPTSIRSKLGGSEGSILDVYGGEYDFDMYTVRLYNKLGQDNGVAIRYGKNLTDLTQEESIANTITGIMPYWADSEGTVIMLDEKVVESDASANYPYPRIAVMDFSSEFESQPTQQQLQQAAEDYIERNDIGVPSVSLSVSFAQLWQTEEYKDIAPLEEVAVFDTVTVQFDELGVDAKAKIRHTTYNVLLERYDSVEIGDARSNISTTLMEQQEKIDQAADPSFLIAAINNATNWITGGRGGYVIFQLNANGQPDEILILDTPSIETAQNVWRWNKGGFGHSKNGYDGPYENAITQDGKIVADFITAGTMLANIIHGGTLTLGGQENGNGVGRVLDANGNEVIRLDNAGVKILKGLLQIGSLFSVDTDGNVVANSLKSSNAEITGGNINIETESDDYSAIMLKYGAYVLSLSASMMQVYEALNPERHASLYCGSGGSGGSLGLGYQTGSEFFIVNHTNLWYSGPTAVFEGDLHVYGNKNRVVKTDKYGERALNAYETTEAWFGDIGNGKISDDGKCTIEIDRIFAETVKLDDYVVFMQAEGPGECYIDAKNANSFVVAGTPGLRFVYEIKAKQKGFENVRLEEYKERKA